MFTTNTNNSEKSKENKTKPKKQNKETKTDKKKKKNSYKLIKNMLHRKKNIVLMLKRSIVEKLIVQSGWELKNGRSKNTSQRTFATFICIGGIKAKSLSQWVSLDLSIVESL